MNNARVNEVVLPKNNVLQAQYTTKPTRAHEERRKKKERGEKRGEGRPKKEKRERNRGEERLRAPAPDSSFVLALRPFM